jgi:3',5'-cyclic AMP phosphodiesterase CpdA
MLAAIPKEAAAGFPVRFVMQSGDAVTSGGDVAQWNLTFTSLIERLTREGGLPFFFAVGNHDIGGAPAGSGEWDRLHNVATAMSGLWPAEGSPRRLDRSAAFAFGFGQYFFIALDSNISTDDTQRTWVRRQLEGLDRRRYPHIVAFFHHPPITSGAHGGPTTVEPQSVAIRNLYLPLFRRHHVRMIIAGHDHLLDHWVEYYADDGGIHRMDQIVSGGGGAPTYLYRGEPDLARYLAEAAPARVRIEHLVRPGSDASDNPHHFLIFEIDGDQIWIQAVGTGPTPFLPYGRQRIELSDR